MPTAPRPLGNVAREAINGMSEMAYTNDTLLKEVAKAIRDNDGKRALYLIGDARRNNTVLLMISELLMAGNTTEAAEMARKLTENE